ncbi:hypothetical protein LJC14_07910 [Treponema sp. OttesenSCG-928-L16]|nr:hypothetical protein [Treponema sp. OttesenSCG-928-L16]
MTEYSVYKAGPDSLPGELTSMIPRISRARGFRLYTADGNRLLDLWQYGGSAVLGHNPPEHLKTLKNSADRGLFTPFPSHYQDRLVKALSLILPGREFRVYAGEDALRRSLLTAGFEEAAGLPFPDPVYAAPESAPQAPPGSALSLWRPFLEEDLFRDIPFLVPVIPLPWMNGPGILAVSGNIGDRAPSLPPSDIVSPLVLALAARAVHNLIAARPGPSSRRFPKIRKALDQSVWKSRGIYLFRDRTDGSDGYDRIFRHFLDHGVLLPPSPRLPAILPGELSKGEEAKLADLLSFRP